MITIGDILSGIDSFKRRLGTMPGLQDQREFGASTPDALTMAQQGAEQSADADSMLGQAQTAGLPLLAVKGLEAMPSYAKSGMLTRAPLPAKGIPDYVQKVIDAIPDTYGPRVAANPEAGRAWFNQEPIYQGFMQENGPERGQQLFDFWNNAIAATTTKQKVPQNLKLASYYLSKYANGELGAGMAMDPWAHMAIEPGYGHMFQGDVNKGLQDVLENGAFDSASNPKKASFAANLGGNYDPATIDQRVSRAIGLVNKSGAPLDAPKIEWYGPIEDAVRATSEAHGLKSAQGQAAGWVVNPEEDPSLVEIVNQMLQRTASKTGKSPMLTLKDFLTGAAPFR